MPNAQLVYLFRFLFFGGLLWLVLFNLSNNPSVDALAYADAVRSGAGYLNPHHLLHGLAGRLVWAPVLSLINPDLFSGPALPYQALAVSNGIAFLLIVFGINQRLVSKGQAIHPAVLPLAAAWGLLRFSVEYEAYLWPLVFCLAGTLAVERKRLGWASLLFTVAFLYHQLSVCWILAALIVLYRKEGWRAALRLATWAWLIPTAYVLAIRTSTPLEMHPYDAGSFLAGNFGTGGVKTEFSLRHLLLLPVSVVRTWVQAHGYVWVLWTRHAPYSLLIALAGLMVAALVWLIGWIGTGRALSFLPEVEAGRSARIARWAIVITLLAGLLSQGNAEFLVGLAPGVALAYPGWFLERRKSAVAMGGLLMGFNFAFGLLPQALLTLSSYRAEAEFVRKGGPRLATYHKLEVRSWLGFTLFDADPDAAVPLPRNLAPTHPRRAEVLHAQRLSSQGGRFIYEGQPIADTLLILERPAPPMLSRQTLVEDTTAGLPGIVGETVETLEHIGGPTRLVELRPNK